MQPRAERCPHCGKATTALKELRLPHRLICVLVYFSLSERVEIGCPDCMRAIMRRNLWSNLLTVNIGWPGLVVLYIPRFRAVARPGPTRLKPTNRLLEDFAAEPSGGARLRAVGIGMAVGIFLLGLWLGFSGGRNNPARPVGWVVLAIGALVVAGMVGWSLRKRGGDRC